MRPAPQLMFKLREESSALSSARKMAFYFVSWWTEFYFCVFVAIFTYYLYFKTIASKYWKNRNVPHTSPVFLLGNLWKTNILQTLDSILLDLYKNWKNEKIVGLWSFVTPVLLITDINIIKNILVRDFNHFRDHGFEFDFETEPLAGHLFNLKGAKWRNLRVKLTPTFTSGKMKMMFPTMVECGKELQEYLKKVADDKKEVEVKEILARFTTDIISSCAFGIETNSLKNPDSEFRTHGKKLFEPSLSIIMKNIIFNLFPKLFSLLKLRIIPKETTDFFLNAVKDTMEYREKNNVKRNDFMELLIQLKNKGKLEEVDEVIPSGALSHEERELIDSEVKFTITDAAAQAFVFFFAGFETSSTTLSFALYELALNTDVQETLQNEIDKVLAKQNGKLTYEGLMEMEYLDWVVQETLRKHPPVTTLFRKCTKDYFIPELNVKVERKCPVFISVFAIHRDPEIYQNPDKFDPTRFSPENKAKRDHFVFLPFGEGPRICIGNRFALLQTKIGLVSILSSYSIRESAKTPSPLSYHPRFFILTPKDGMHLKFAARN